MNPEVPTVSSFRVEKPGKSKFAPSLGARKPATPASAPTAPVKEKEKEPAPVKQEKVEVEEEEEEIVLEEDIKTSLDTETTVASAVVGTKIESIRSRRRQSVTTETVTASITSELILPEKPESAASLTTTATITPKQAPKRTMAYFLKDNGEGREMSTVDDQGKETKNKTTKRRVVDLKSIKSVSKSTATAIAPQVRIVDGVIVYDEDVAATTVTETLEDASMELEYADEDGKHLTSATYAKKAVVNRWRAEETELFYEALSMCGTDFSMIASILPHRNRAQIKGKYKIEERANLARINECLRRRKPFDSDFPAKVAQIMSAKKKGNSNDDSDSDSS